MSHRLPFAASLSGIALILMAGCTGGTALHPYAAVNAGDSNQGRALTLEYNCGSCHIIPGVPHATGLVGPPLTGFAMRTYIAGLLPNTAPNLVLWIKSPQSVDPGNAMPDMGISEPQARSIAAYLYTLH